MEIARLGSLLWRELLAFEDTESVERFQWRLVQHINGRVVGDFLRLFIVHIDVTLNQERAAVFTRDRIPSRVETSWIT